jgi:hypothetical protein
VRYWILILGLIQGCALLPITEDDQFNQEPDSATPSSWPSSWPNSWEEVQQQLELQREEQRELAQEADLRHQRNISSAISNQDITLGMSIDQVTRIWGEPHEVGYAGDPGAGNERWVYSNGLTSPRAGISGGRVLYFEGGLVSGWEAID